MDKLLEKRKELGDLAQEKFWRIGEETGKFLQQLLKDRKCKNVLEIGTSSGYSALWILEVLNGNNGHLWTIESHAKRFELAQKTFQEADATHLVTQIKGHAPEAINELETDLKFDFVFIDATKYETQSHFEAALKHLNSQGIVVIDNIATHREKFEGFFSFLEKNEYKYYEQKIEAGVLVIEL